MFISDNETEVDLLYYDAIAQTVVRLIDSSGDKPLTIGVHGDWGAGKSSVLAMIGKCLATRKEVLALRFNGWQFQGFEDAKAALLETIITSLRDSRSGNKKVAEKAKDLLKRVDYLKLAKKGLQLAFTVSTGIPHPEQISDAMGLLKGLASAGKKDLTPDGVKGVVDQAVGILKPGEEKRIPEQMIAFEREFRGLIDAAKLERLVVLIDDLDRCLPETAIETLEAIRLFLFAPKTTFVIATDEVMIQYAVRRHFPDLPLTSGPLRYDQNYLEKLIQVPFRIPALGPIETQTYITLAMAEAALGQEDPQFRKLLEAGRRNIVQPWAAKLLDLSTVGECFDNGTIPDVVAQAVTFSTQVFRILTDGTKGNPRQVKRFLNAMLLRNAVAEARGLASQIKIPKLAKIMLAEQFATGFFDQLTNAAYQASDGKPQCLAELEAAARKEPEAKDADTAQEPIEQNEWLTDDWAMRWAAIDPALADDDLRPYLFITRDRKGSFLGMAAASHIEAMVERLMGRDMAVNMATEDIAKLTAQDAEAVFAAVSAKVIQSADLAQRPKGFAGLLVLIEKHPALQLRLLQLLEAVPADRLGAWPATGFTRLFTDPGAKERFEALRDRWKREGSPKLKKALKAFSSARKPVSRG